MAHFDFPELEKEYLFVATRHDSEYPFNRGDIVTSRGDIISIRDYENYFFEEHVKYTHALQSYFGKDEAYLVGPLARFYVNYDLLPTHCREVAAHYNLGTKVLNPFKSLLVRGIEVLFALEEAVRIMDQVNNMPKTPAVEVDKVYESIGYGCTEAPRGMLWHRYKIDNEGLIEEAKIVPPTSQNQRMIENDLIDVAKDNLHMKDEALKWRLEQAIRNYDPCISCATHFLKLDVKRL